MEKRDAEFWTDEHKKHPSRVVPVAVSLFGIFYILVALADFFLLGNLWGVLFTVTLIPPGLFCLIVGGYALATTRYTEPFGTNAYDRAFLDNYKNVLAAVAVVLWLCFGIACLSFL